MRMFEGGDELLFRGSLADGAERGWDGFWC